MTTPTSANPLLDYFRQPAIYIRLPAGGQYWPDGSIDIPESGEIPVYPMTAKDEIILKTPDALMNGEGMASVIKSCCPNILNPWMIPVCDLDAILIAIRLTSYGQEMDITSECAHCKETNENVVDLSALLDRLPKPSYTNKTYGQLEIQFKPQTFQSLNTANLAIFEQQSLLNTIASSTLSDMEKQSEFKKILPRITDLNVQTLIDAIESITIGDKKVTNDEHIREFINNCDRKTFEDLKSEIEKIAQANKAQPLEIACSSCEKTYTTALNFENSNFFG